MLDKKRSPDLENKISDLFAKLNGSKKIGKYILKNSISISSAIFHQDPSYKDFITALFQKTQDEKIKNEILNMLNEKMK